MGEERQWSVPEVVGKQGNPVRVPGGLIPARGPRSPEGHRQNKLISLACCAWKFGGFQSPLTHVPEWKTGPISCPQHFTHSQGVRLLLSCSEELRRAEKSLRQHTAAKNVACTTNKELMSSIYKELLRINKKKAKLPQRIYSSMQKYKWPT